MQHLGDTGERPETVGDLKEKEGRREKKDSK